MTRVLDGGGVPHESIPVNIVSGTAAITATRPALTTVTGTVNASGDNTIINGPSAGNQLVIYELQLQLEETAQQTILVKGGTTTLRRFIGAALGAGMSFDPPLGKELPLGDGSALKLNLSVAKIVGYVVRYKSEAL